MGKGLWWVALGSTLSLTACGPLEVSGGSSAEANAPGRPSPAPWGGSPPSGTPVAITPALPSPTVRAECPELYAEDLLPTYEIEISSSHWAKLESELRSGLENYYPVTFRYGGEVRSDAMMRLRGNNSDCKDLMQFAISFNRVDPKGRFRGLRRINLDHGGCHLFEERLALSYMRDLGLPAACANHARLVVNGKLYGVFTHVEHVNQDFLARLFPGEDGGNLYKSGDKLRTNEAEGNTADVEALEAARDLAAVDALVDLEEAVREWAAEATLPARDNFWAKGYNYYLYHHPSRGFLFIPTDFDQALPGSDTVRLDLFWPRTLRHPAEVVLDDARWRAEYEAALRTSIAAFDLATFEARLDRWWAQLRPTAENDPYYGFNDEKLEKLKARLRDRAAWLKERLDEL